MVAFLCQVFLASDPHLFFWLMAYEKMGMARLYLGPRRGANRILEAAKIGFLGFDALTNSGRYRVLLLCKIRLSTSNPNLFKASTARG
jgi:hypothetical protein